jgi:hypothetical protein
MRVTQAVKYLSEEFDGSVEVAAPEGCVAL